jgi:hypothetical protein
MVWITLLFLVLKEEKFFKALSEKTTEREGELVEGFEKRRGLVRTKILVLVLGKRKIAFPGGLYSHFFNKLFLFSTTRDKGQGTREGMNQIIYLELHLPTRFHLREQIFLHFFY